MIHMRNLKQVLNHGLLLENVCRVIKFNQRSGLKLYIDMNANLRKKAKEWFPKKFLQVDELVSLWESYGKCSKT